MRLLEKKVPEKGDENDSKEVLWLDANELKKRSPRKGTKTHKSSQTNDLSWRVEKKVPEKGDENSATFTGFSAVTLPIEKKVPEKGDENLPKHRNKHFPYLLKKRSPRKGTKTRGEFFVHCDDNR